MTNTIMVPMPNGDTIEMPFIQAMRIAELTKKHGGHAHWHPNECALDPNDPCPGCYSLHGPDCAYLIGPDGTYHVFEGRGCECPPD